MKLWPFFPSSGPSRVRAVTLMIIGVVLVLIVQLETRPRYKFQVSYYDGRSVLYVVPGRVWHDSLAPLCLGRITQVRDSILRADNGDSRHHTTSRQYDAPYLTDLSWPLAAPVYRRAAMLAQGVATDSSVTSPAGYAGPVTIGDDDLLILVRSSGGTAVVLGVRFNESLHSLQAISSSALDGRICGSVFVS